LWITDEANDRLVRCDNRLNFVDEIRLVDEEDALKYGAPSGLAVTDYGEVWMADRENNRLATFDNTGRFDRFIGDYGYTGGQLSAPEKVLAVKGRRFVVCDAGNGRLAVYDDFGNHLHDITDPTLENPISVAIATDGLIWILEGRTARLCCFSSSGDMIFSTGPQIVGSDRPLKSPSDIAFLRDGRMLITDSGNDRVMVCRVLVPEE
jgi:sugar lactone lactonase YvrE